MGGLAGVVGRAGLARGGLPRGDLVAIGLGGTAGAACRWAIIDAANATDGGWFAYAPNTALTIAADPGIPGRTLLVNLLGCGLLGALTVMLRRSAGQRQRRVLIGLATGFCGSLTTFSTFAAEVAELLDGRFDSAPGDAVLYLGLSLAGGGLAFASGRAAARLVTGRLAP